VNTKVLLHALQSIPVDFQGFRMGDGSSTQQECNKNAARYAAVGSYLIRNWSVKLERYRYAGAKLAASQQKQPA
jgi:hypothetical protein